MLQRRLSKWYFAIGFIVCKKAKEPRIEKYAERATTNYWGGDCRLACLLTSNPYIEIDNKVTSYSDQQRSYLTT